MYKKKSFLISAERISVIPRAWWLDDSYLHEISSLVLTEVELKKETIIYVSAYLSSLCIIMQVKCCARVVSFFQFVDEASRLLLSKLDVITAPSPLPVAVSLRLFSRFTAPASGYSVLCALKRDLVCDGGGADGVKESCLASSCKDKTRYKSDQLLNIIR